MISEKFKKDVREGNMQNIYISLAASMPNDPSLRRFNEMFNYATSALSNLYQPHNEEDLKYSESDWTGEYYDKQQAALNRNFSKERVDLMKKMTPHVLAEKIAVRKVEELEKSKVPSSPSIKPKQVGCVTAAAGVVGCGIGLAAGSTALAVGGGVVAIMGAAIALMSDS